MVPQVAGEDEFRDELAATTPGDTGPAALPRLKRKVVRKLANEDAAFRDFAQLKKKQVLCSQAHLMSSIIRTQKTNNGSELYTFDLHLRVICVKCVRRVP